MSIAPVSTKIKIDNTATATNIVLDRPPHLENDGILLVCIGLIRAVATITWSTPPTGFTLLTNDSNNPTHGAWYYKKLTAAEYPASSEPSTYTFSWTGGGRVAASILFIKDVDVNDIIEGFNTAKATSNGSDTSTVTPANDGCLILKYHLNDNANGVTITNPTGYTELLNFQSGTGAASAEQGLSYAIQTTAAAAGAASWSMSASEQWIGCTIAINTKDTVEPASESTTNKIKYSNVPNTFSRAVTTLDQDGNEVAENVIRTGKPIYYMPTLSWSTLMAIPGTDASFRSSGVDHDGVTPLTVWYKASSNTHYFYRGTTLVTTLVGDDLMEGTEASTYKATPGIFIYNGAIIFQCERHEGGVIKGVGLVVSQDCGLTFSIIEKVGGGEIEEIAGDVSSGKARGHRWSLCGAFPAIEGSELTSVFVPWADYIAKVDSPQGGQIGVFKMTRSSTTGTWTIHPNREIYQYWEVGASGNGTHAHTAALCAEGLISHHGDVGYRNRTFIHLLDLTDYENATIDTHEVYGGYSNTNTVYREAAQPVGAIPSNVFGRHFAAGDESSPAVGEYRWDNENDCLRIKTVGEEIRNSIAGTTWDSANYLVSYHVGTKKLITPFYSPDGVKWARTPGSLRFYGSTHFLRANSGNVEIAKIPSIETIYPVCINPGGKNVLDQFTQISAPGAGVTVEDVYWDSEMELFKKTVGDTALDPQPPKGPFFEQTIFKLFSTSGSRTAGGYTLSSANLNITKNKAFDVWGFNLARVNGLTVDIGVGFSLTYQCGTTNRVDTENGSITADNETWIDFSEICNDPSSRETAAARWNGFLGPSSSNTYPDRKTLVAFKGISETDSVSYPIKPGIITDMPDEKLEFQLTSSPTWSWNGVFYYPQSCKGVVDATNGYSRVFCTLYQDATNHIEISARTTTTIRFAVTIGGSTTNHDVSVGTGYSPAGLYWGDVIELFVKTDGDNMVLYAKVGYDSTFTTATTTGKISPVSARISNKDKTEVQDIRVLGNFYWAKEQDDTILSKSLSLRAGGSGPIASITDIFSSVVSNVV